LGTCTSLGGLGFGSENPSEEFEDVRRKRLATEDGRVIFLTVGGGADIDCAVAV
jgi:hypothetical protein